MKSRLSLINPPLAEQAFQGSQQVSLLSQSKPVFTAFIIHANVTMKQNQEHALKLKSMKWIR